MSFIISVSYNQVHYYTHLGPLITPLTPSTQANDHLRSFDKEKEKDQIRIVSNIVKHNFKYRNFMLSILPERSKLIDIDELRPSSEYIFAPFVVVL